MKYFKIIVIALITSPYFSFSQEVAPDDYIIEIQNLNPEMYRDYVLASMEDDNFLISESCVPAHLICVQVTNENLSNVKTYLANFFSSMTATEIEVLENYSRSAFNERCANARIGK